MAQNLLQVRRICSAVVLSYLDAGFEPKEFYTVCFLLAGAAAAAAKIGCSPRTLRRVVKPQQGEPSSINHVPIHRLVLPYPVEHKTLTKEMCTAFCDFRHTSIVEIVFSDYGECRWSSAPGGMAIWT